jgi:DNA-binding beta-propeller fold protein YncE
MNTFTLAIVVLLLITGVAVSGQPPHGASSPDVSVSHRDRVYAAEQFSNTVSVTDPVDNRLLGVIRLGDPPAKIPDAGRSFSSRT